MAIVQAVGGLGNCSSWLHRVLGALQGEPHCSLSSQAKVLAMTKKTYPFRFGPLAYRQYARSRELYVSFFFFFPICFSKNICLFPTTKKSSLVHQQWAKLRFNKHIFLFPTTKKKLADSPKTNKMFCFQPQKKTHWCTKKQKKKTLNTTYLFVSNHKIKVRWCIKKKKR